MSTLRKRLAGWALPVAAVGLFGFAVVTVIEPERSRAAPPAPPAAAATTAATIAGIGTVEPPSLAIAIAAELPGVVRDVHVRVGDHVAAGAPLFTQDGRAVRAAIAAAEARLAAAEAAVATAEVALADERQRLSLFEAVPDKRALSADELARRRFASQRAAAALDAARAEVRVAAADLAARRVELARLTVTAPIAGRLYRVDIRPGEFAPAGVIDPPLMVMGSDQPLHVRVEIDEADAPRLRPGAGAIGRLRGAAGTAIPLRYVRTEPQVTEKRALSGGAERVDTRVVEVLYSFDPARFPAYLGQRMDVFVDAPGRGA